jgi:hypothetical protein
MRPASEASRRKSTIPVPGDNHSPAKSEARDSLASGDRTRDMGPIARGIPAETARRMIEYHCIAPLVLLAPSDTCRPVVEARQDRHTPRAREKAAAEKHGTGTDLRIEIPQKIANESQDTAREASTGKRALPVTMAPDPAGEQRSVSRVFLSLSPAKESIASGPAIYRGMIAKTMAAADGSPNLEGTK